MVVNDGLIAGGLSFGGVRADAIDFSNGGNLLELWSHNQFQGNIVATHSLSQTDTFALGGTANGTFDVSKFGNQFQGFNAFEKNGTSLWTLTGTTTELTPWKLNAGTLSVSQEGNLGNLAGGLTFDGGTLQVTGTSYTTTPRSLTILAGGGGFDIDSAANIFTLNQPIIGGVANDGGIWKTGPGTLTLNALNTYTGLTDIMEGKLVIGDTVAHGLTAYVQGDATVALGATLAGHGTVGGTVENLGTVAPGNNDFGTLTIKGNYYGTGTLAIKLDGNSGPGVISDHLVVGGEADLTGGTLRLVKSSYEMSCGDKTQVIIAGSYNGQVSLFDISAFNKLMLFDNGTGWVYGVNILQGQNLGSLPGLNGNQQAVANALGSDVLNPQHFIDETKPLDKALLEVIADCDLKGQRLDLLSPESYAGFADYGIQVTRNYTRTAMGVPGPGEVQQPAPPPAMDNKGGMAKGGMPPAPPAPASLDTTVFGAFSHYDGKSSSSNNGADYDLNSNGGIAGARHTINNFTFGGFVGVDDGKVSSAFVNADVSGWVLGGFASYLADKQRNIIVDGGLTYGSYQFDGTRNTLSGLANFDGGDTNVYDVFASVRGDVYNKDKLRLTPMLSVHYLDAKVGSINESGTGTALAVGSMSDDALLTEISLNAEYKATTTLTLLGNIGYTHNFLDVSRQVSASFIYGRTPFSVIAPGMGEDIFSIGAGAIWNVTDAWTVGANYRAEFSSNTNPSNSLGLSISYSF